MALVTVDGREGTEWDPLGVAGYTYDDSTLAKAADGRWYAKTPEGQLVNVSGSFNLQSQHDSAVAGPDAAATLQAADKGWANQDTSFDSGLLVGAALLGGFGAIIASGAGVAAGAVGTGGTAGEVAAGTALGGELSVGAATGATTAAAAAPVAAAASTGPTLSSVAMGAGKGALMNAVGSVVTGKPITAGGLLTGAVTGGFGSIVSSYVGGMFPDSPFIGQVAGMAAGALAGGLIGQATGTGAGQGAASGGAGGVTGAVTTAPTVNNLPTFGQSGQGILSFNPVERRPIDWAAKRG